MVSTQKTQNKIFPKKPQLFQAILGLYVVVPPCKQLETYSSSIHCKLKKCYFGPMVRQSSMHRFVTKH